MATVASLDELKAFLNYGSGGADDAELDMVLDAAEEQALAIVGTVTGSSVTETVTTSHEGVAVLSSTPVQSVTSVATSDGYVYAPADYTVRGTAGLIRDLPRGITLTVVYVPGRATVPQSVKLAVLVIAGHLWETQRGPAPSPLSPDGPVFAPGLGFAIPARAAQLLEPYVQARGIG